MELFWVRSKRRHSRKKPRIKSEDMKHIKDSVAMAEPRDIGRSLHRAMGNPASAPTHHLFSPSPLPLQDPRPPHREPHCNCPNCPYSKKTQHHRPLSPHSVSSDPEDVVEEPPFRQKTKASIAKRGNPKVQFMPQPPKSPESPTTILPKASQQLYVYPRSTPHITFPVVDYNKQRSVQEPSSPWPACYMAVAPDLATPRDIEAILAPPGSGLVVLARATETGEPVPLTDFRDAMDIRRGSFQLEIWDEKAGPGPSKEVK